MNSCGQDTLIISDKCVVEIPRSAKYKSYLDSIYDNDTRNSIDSDYLFYSSQSDSIIEAFGLKLVFGDYKNICFIKNDGIKKVIQPDTLWDRGFSMIFFVPEKEPYFYKGILDSNDLQKYFK